mgnify:CR=1 FL=1
MVLKAPEQFPESLVQSTGAGPDFPGSSGDRERGKFRPSATPRLTQVAVTGDDGRPVARTTDELLAGILLWQKAMVIAQIWNMEGLSFTLQELLDEASHT